MVKPFTWCRTLWDIWKPTVAFFPTLKVKFLMQNESKVLSHLQIFGHSKEGAQLCLGNVHLPVVHEVEHGQDAFILDAPQVEQGVVVWVPLQHPSKER